MAEHRFHTIKVPGTELCYLDTGADMASENAPLVTLIHGFASNANVNWLETGWVRHLHRAGYRVLAPDNRGHGGSEKHHEREAYSVQIMAADIVGLWDALNIQKSYLVGYSMGARISLALCGAFDERVQRLSIGGNGDAIVRDRSDWHGVAASLLATSDEAPEITAGGRVFRQFAQRTGSDLKALAACVVGALEPFSAEQIARVTVPTLVAVGTDDNVAGDLDGLVKMLPAAHGLSLVGKNHMSAVGDREWKNATLEHLQR
ncbi:MAG: alpha/beta fold hydrolase [Pseudomonadota bacterium]